MSHKRKLVVFEPRGNYRTTTVQLLSGLIPSTSIISKLSDLISAARGEESFVILVDSELSLPDSGFYTVISRVLGVNEGARFVFLVPSELSKQRFHQLISLDPLDVITRSLPPNSIRDRLRHKLDSLEDREKVVDVAKRMLTEGAFESGDYNSDCSRIHKSGAGGAGSLAAFTYASRAGDPRRATKHLVDAYKAMPYSFPLFEMVLARCSGSDGVYKAAKLFALNHPVQTPFYKQGCMMALVKLGDDARRGIVEGIMNSRLNSHNV